MSTNQYYSFSRANESWRLIYVFVCSSFVTWECVGREIPVARKTFLFKTQSWCGCSVELRWKKTPADWMTGGGGRSVGSQFAPSVGRSLPHWLTVAFQNYRWNGALRSAGGMKVNREGRVVASVTGGGNKRTSDEHDVSAGSMYFTIFIFHEHSEWFSITLTAVEMEILHKE